MKNKEKRNVVLFAASQGGHFAEMMKLKDLFGKYESVLATDNLKATKEREDLKAFKHIAYSKATAERREKEAGKKQGSRWKLNTLWTYFRLFTRCFVIYVKYRPQIIISTGSHIAVPFFIYGKIFGSKTLYIESNAKVYSKSMTGKLVERFSDKIYVQWPEMLNVYPQAEYHGVLH